MQNETLEFRLENIESQLAELKALLIKVPLMSENMNAQEKRIGALEAMSDMFRRDLDAMKHAPDEVSAERWKQIVDYVYKALIAVAVGAVMAKMGLIL